MIWDNKICKIINSLLMVFGKFKFVKEVILVFGILVCVVELEDIGGLMCVWVKIVKKFGKEEDV